MLARIMAISTALVACSCHTTEPQVRPRGAPIPGRPVSRTKPPGCRQLARALPKCRWPCEASRALRLLPTFGHRGPLTALAFHPNGRQVLSASWDGTIRIWDRQSGEIQRLVAQARDLRKLNEDDRFPTCRVRLRHPRSHALLATLVVRGSDDWVLHTPAGYLDASASGRRGVLWSHRRKQHPWRHGWKRYHVPRLLEVLKACTQR